MLPPGNYCRDPDIFCAKFFKTRVSLNRRDIWFDSIGLLMIFINPCRDASWTFQDTPFQNNIYFARLSAAAIAFD